METTFIYSESARRKAQKKKALEEGEAEQQKLAKLGKVPAANQTWEHRPPHPSNKDQRAAGLPEALPTAPPKPAARVVRVARKPQKSAAPVSAPAGTAAPVVKVRVRAVPAAAAKPRAAAPAAPQAPPSPPVARPAAARQPAARPQGAAPRVAGARQGVASKLKASEERLLLESQALDLFGKGVTSQPCICPECQHELVKVMALGAPVRACIECKGLWMPLPVMRELAKSNEWFGQLVPAIQAMVRPKPST